MQSQIESYISHKNNWLSKQVDVEFPTPESIAGRMLYLESQQGKKYKESEMQVLLVEEWAQDVIEVDFHRLTILFAILQASKWENEPKNECLIIEFLTQIILDDEYQLYLGFNDGEPVSALVCKVDFDNNLVFLSDVVIAKKSQDSANEQTFASDVLRHLNAKSLIINKVIHPNWE